MDIFKTLDMFGIKPEEVTVPNNNTQIDKPNIGTRQPIL